MDKKEEKVVNCHNGWKTLYEPIIKEVINYDRHKLSFNEKIGLSSIENNHGMMVFKTYNDMNIPMELRRKMSVASCESLKVCEFCGTKENVGYTCCNTTSSCCKDCFDKHIKSIFPRENWYERKVYSRD